MKDYTGHNTMFAPDRLVTTNDAVSLPKKKCDRYGIEEGDLVDVLYVINDTIEKPMGLMEVGAERRIPVPPNTQDRYDLEPGEDYLDVIVDYGEEVEVEVDIEKNE